MEEGSERGEGGGGSGVNWRKLSGKKGEKRDLRERERERERERHEAGGGGGGISAHPQN